MGRGKLTDEVIQKGKELLGIELTKEMLRLIPYIDFTLKNSRSLQNISVQENRIIEKWHEKGWILGSRSKLTVSKEFYTAMNEILWLAYINYDEEEK